MDRGMQELMKASRRARVNGVKVSQSEWDALEREHERTYGFADNRRYETWLPAERAGYTPSPRLLKPTTGKENPTWKDYLIEENFDQEWIILGAGAGALEHARSMDGRIVYGINWTTRWFRPTFLQAVDGQVFREELWTKRGREAKQDTQFVCSKWIAYQRMPDEREHEGFLIFDIINPNKKRTLEARVFAEHPGAQMGWAPNSLFFALNVAHWFRPKRIALVGFDFGGPHFFGDGRQAGADGDYGFNSNAKSDLHDRLRWMRQEMESRGNVIRHVRPTALDVFKQVDTIEEAFA